jgi:hypothetical protein
VKLGAEKQAVSAMDQSEMETELSQRINDAVDKLSAVSQPCQSLQFLRNCCAKLGASEASLSRLGEKQLESELVRLIDDKVSELDRQLSVKHDELEHRLQCLKSCCSKLGASQQSISQLSEQQLEDELSHLIDEKMTELENCKAVFADLSEEQPSPQKRDFGCGTDVPFWDEAKERRLELLDNTLKVISPLDEVLLKMCHLLSKKYGAFLPTSKYFKNYLDGLSFMKAEMHKVEADTVIRPIHSLLVKCVELFGCLAVLLSSAAFAPEFAENQQALEKIFEKQMSSNLSLMRLRVLLEERDSLLMQETGKLAELEEAFELATGRSARMVD